MSLPTVQNDREPLTLAEAISVGRAASQLGALRAALSKVSDGGTLSCKTGSSVTGIPITSTEAQALLALLIERQVALLTAFNVEVPHA